MTISLNLETLKEVAQLCQSISFCITTFFGSQVCLALSPIIHIPLLNREIVSKYQTYFYLLLQRMMWFCLRFHLFYSFWSHFWVWRVTWLREVIRLEDSVYWWRFCSLLLPLSGPCLTIYQKYHISHIWFVTASVSVHCYIICTGIRGSFK